MNFQNYRPDIDGLRAIAVLSVILFHINKAILPGGFVGVDIFFVISGYLITLHILRDIDRGSFSLVEFYCRRVKRIAPAMLVVIAITMLIAQFVYRPEDAIKVAQSGFASLLSLANVYFWLFQHTSYFAAPSSQIPLLHLWSLGIEEQFYIFWPLILMGIYKKIRSPIFIISIVLIAIVSFVLGELLFDVYPSFVYYMLPTRAGELLVGAIAAYTVIKKNTCKLPAIFFAVTAVLGLILLVGSLIFLSEDEVFPGFQALPPTIGAALLILAGHYKKTWPSRLLMLRPLTWVGLISYSAYLWHWPLLAFYRYGQWEVDIVAGTVIFTFTIFLAWISYQYVERPARLSRSSAIQIFKRQYIIPAGSLIILSLGAMKFEGYGLRWISEDYKTSLAEISDKTRPAYHYDYVCQSYKITPEHVANDQCVVGSDLNDFPKAILWGDSNAAHFIGMLGVFAREEGFRFRNLVHSWCPPLNSDPEDYLPAKRVSDCRQSLKTIWKALDSFQVIIISASWTAYQSRSEKFLEVFFDTVRELVNQGKLVILLGKVPVISTYDRLCAEKKLIYPFMKCKLAASVPLSQKIAKINTRLKEFAFSSPNVEYYDITKYLCPDGECFAYDKNGKPIYYDPSHLALPASWEIGNNIFQSDGVPFPFTLISGRQQTAKVIGPRGNVN